MSSRPRLEATLIAVLDVGDQPAAPYVFVVEGLLGPRQAFSIDSWQVDKESVTGYRTTTLRGLGGIPDAYTKVAVITVPVNAPWAVVNRGDLIFTTLTESARKRKVDDLAQANFEKELYPATPESKPAIPRPDLASLPGMYI